MLFPEAERQVYSKNPLRQVICQLRFPTILRINEVAPAVFQDRIRKHYPHYQEKFGMNLPSEILDQVPPAFARVFSDARSTKAYEFISADREWVVSLTRDFLALTAHKYLRWEAFKSHLEAPLSALVEVYSPTLFSRLGLRYQNVIRRSALGLENVDWVKLLNPYIAAELADSSISSSIAEGAHQIVFNLEKYHAKARLQHGLIMDEGDRGETCYLIDSDFFTEQETETSDAEGIIDYFNKYNQLLFQWCISRTLHAAMAPSPI